MNGNSIIIIDDDDDDLDLIKQAFEALQIKNEIIIFNHGHDFIQYMTETDTKIFFILCDINMSKISGLELKEIIHANERLRLKCVPFLFLSTSSASASIMKAYSFNVQGYFIKPSTFDGIKGLLDHIIQYWSISQHPNL